MSLSAPALPLPVVALAPEGAVRLTDWGVIRATGADAPRFLHGQLTQDIEHLGGGLARLAGYCSVKGRLLATFVVWRRGADEVLLACSADLLPATLKRLSMFVLRAQCKLTDASADIPLWGLAGTAASGALGEAANGRPWELARVSGAEVLRLPDGQAVGRSVARWLWAGAEPPALPLLDFDSWQGLEASSGVARVVAATVEQFVPQMVNLDLVDGVNFQKGCYPGQEVVARSQYRGTLKRRAMVMLCPESLRPGQEVFHDGDPDQPAGRVVLAGSLPGSSTVALVEIKLAALSGGTLHAGSVAGPTLSLAALPYAIPAEAA